MADLPTREATAPDLSQVPTVSGYVDSQISAENAALDPIIKAMQAREKPLDIYTKLENEAGIPQLRTTAGNIGKEINRLEDTLGGLEANISGRTRESMVTEAMRGRMVAAEAQPMQDNLSKLTTGLGRIQQAISEGMEGINTKTGLTIQGQQYDLEPLQLKYSTLVEQDARKLTGFTADRQTAIDQIYAKWQRGNTISDQEWQLAAEAAQSEREYTQAVSKAAASAGISDLSGSTADILARVGKTVSDQQSFENKMKSYTTYKSSDGTTTTTTPNTATPSVTPASDLLSYWKAFQ